MPSPTDGIAQAFMILYAIAAVVLALIALAICWAVDAWLVGIPVWLWIGAPVMAAAVPFVGSYIANRVL
ncbi:hypothetical protein [Fodinicurvata sediminis]|uniref:hypothetical protein n=1 Tax=Fodinicurvata sediminis TaxID=1121832 RepID=UPI0003B6DE0B|nr:hypothetical protein [Fodinicurvata sediminis]